MAKLVAGGGPPLPEDLIIWEILILLPATSLLRCRAVCRFWRRHLTSDAKFLLAHHRRQPSLPLVITTGHSSTDEKRVDALDLRAGERRPVATSGAEDSLRVLASCDGLLILDSGGGLQICNPATRQLAPLPLIHSPHFTIAALYPHRQSGSYRVLCCFMRAQDGPAVYHVHTLGSGELRCVGEPPGLWASGFMPREMWMIVLFHPPVLADGRIYWQQVKLEPPGGNGKRNNMLVFDTIAESFQHLLSPVEGAASIELFETSSGALGLYRDNGGTADLWVLQDHRSGTWSLNSRIKLPVDSVSMMPVLNPEGDVLVIRVGRKQLQHISGVNGSLLARYEWNSSLYFRRHRFRESLVRHDFFLMEGNDGVVDGGPLFDGLTTVALVRDDNFEPN